MGLRLLEVRLLSLLEVRAWQGWRGQQCEAKRGHVAAAAGQKGQVRRGAASACGDVAGAEGASVARAADVGWGRRGEGGVGLAAKRPRVTYPAVHDALMRRLEQRRLGAFRDAVSNWGFKRGCVFG